VIAVMQGWLVRHVTYPLWQWRRKGSVLAALASMDRTQWLATPALAALQLERLRALVGCAWERSPFYRETFTRASVTPAEIRALTDLERLPVLEKADVRDRLADMMVRDAGADLVKRQTSGSTGIPMVVWASPKARDEWVAASQRFVRWWGVDVGDRRLTLISRHDLTRLGWSKQYLFANVVEYSAMDLSEATLARLRDWIVRGGTRLLLGYPSSLAYLAQYLALGGPLRGSRLRVVVTTGEMLHQDQRRLLERVFRCPVADEYGASEVGHIAGECPEGRMHVAAENVIVECLTSPVNGASGAGELLVTDLTNFAVPLIRYRIGDLGSFGGACPCGRGLPVLNLRVGRSSDLVILPDGRHMDFSVFDAVAEEVAARGRHLRQFRVIQHAPNRFEVLLAGPDELREVTGAVRDRMLGVLRARVSIEVRRVDEIPPDPAGKRRRFISHIAGRTVQ
jgi:phenylacetate-CoA ligase